MRQASKHFGAKQGVKVISNYAESFEVVWLVKALQDKIYGGSRNVIVTDVEITNFGEWKGDSETFSRFGQII